MPARSALSARPGPGAALRLTGITTGDNSLQEGGGGLGTVSGYRLTACIRCKVEHPDDFPPPLAYLTASPENRPEDPPLLLWEPIRLIERPPKPNAPLRRSWDVEYFRYSSGPFEPLSR